MLSFLNSFSLPVRSAIIGFVALPLGLMLARYLGFESGSSSLMLSAFAGAIGGYIGGWLRERWLRKAR